MCVGCVFCLAQFLTHSLSQFTVLWCLTKDGQFVVFFLGGKYVVCYFYLYISKYFVGWNFNGCRKFSNSIPALYNSIFYGEVCIKMYSLSSIVVIFFKGNSKYCVNQFFIIWTLRVVYINLQLSTSLVIFLSVSHYKIKWWQLSQYNHVFILYLKCWDVVNGFRVFVVKWAYDGFIYHIRILLLLYKIYCERFKNCHQNHSTYFCRVLFYVCVYEEYL